MLNPKHNFVPDNKKKIDCLNWNQHPVISLLLEETICDRKNIEIYNTVIEVCSFLMEIKKKTSKTVKSAPCWQAHNIPHHVSNTEKGKLVLMHF